MRFLFGRLSRLETKCGPHQNMAQIQDHFIRAFKEVREAAATIKTGGYANMCRRKITELAAAQEVANNETHQALLNFVSAASADRTTIIFLTKNNCRPIN